MLSLICILSAEKKTLAIADNLKPKFVILKYCFLPRNAL